MSTEFFEDTKFKAESLEQIEVANDIIASYRRQGYTLSLRQLYYQFVSRNLIANTERSYKNLGNLITKGRMAGLISWTAIEDRNRGRSGWYIQEDVEEIISDLPRQFAVDMWANQSFYVEVWVEKDALSSVIERACRKYRVPYMACKGYLSASEAWRAGKRYEDAMCAGKEPVIVHLGDHDPSGIDMTRDNQDRVTMFSNSFMSVETRRIALNMDQIDEYSPPPNPAKVTDSRAADYIANYGRTSWELDALEPSVVEALVHNEIETLLDFDQWQDDLDRETEQKDELRKLGQNWDDVKEFINGL